MCAQIFTSALLSIAEIWKQTKCPSMDEWTKDGYGNIYIYIYTHNLHVHVIHIHSMNYHMSIHQIHMHNGNKSGIKNNEILQLFTTWTDNESSMPSKVSHTERHTETNAI